MKQVYDDKAFKHMPLKIRIAVWAATLALSIESAAEQDSGKQGGSSKGLRPVTRKSSKRSVSGGAAGNVAGGWDLQKNGNVSSQAVEFGCALFGQRYLPLPEKK